MTTSIEQQRLLTAVRDRNIKKIREMLPDVAVDNDVWDTAHREYESAKRVLEMVESGFLCSNTGIDQQYAACVFAAALTLCYRIRSLYRDMHADIKRMVHKCCKTGYSMPRPPRALASGPCPLMPLRLRNMYRRISGRSHIYNGNVATEVLDTLFMYSGLTLQKMTPDRRCTDIRAVHNWLQGGAQTVTKRDKGVVRKAAWRLLCVDGVTLDNQNGRRDLRQATRCLKDMCTKFAAIGGMINAYTLARNGDGGHTWAFSVCRDDTIWLCSRGKCRVCN